MKKALFVFAALTLPAIYGASDNYRFSLLHKATLSGNQLSPGDYRILVDGAKGTVKVGKTMIEVPVKVETADHKFRDTSVSMEGPAGNLKINEIDIGGSTTRIIIPVGQ
jgi:hypothetical protein